MARQVDHQRRALVGHQPRAARSPTSPTLDASISPSIGADRHIAVPLLAHRGRAASCAAAPSVRRRTTRRPVVRRADVDGVHQRPHHRDSAAAVRSPRRAPAAAVAHGRRSPRRPRRSPRRRTWRRPGAYACSIAFAHASWHGDDDVVDLVARRAPRGRSQRRSSGRIAASASGSRGPARLQLLRQRLDARDQHAPRRPPAGSPRISPRHRRAQRLESPRPPRARAAARGPSSIDSPRTSTAPSVTSTTSRRRAARTSCSRSARARDRPSATPPCARRNAASPPAADQRRQVPGVDHASRSRLGSSTT